jgi:hypothetical protein
MFPYTTFIPLLYLCAHSLHTNTPFLRPGPDATLPLIFIMATSLLVNVVYVFYKRAAADNKMYALIMRSNVEVVQELIRRVEASEGRGGDAGQEDH